eukprot:1139049-Pelagomonas_calceolata.AAC.17
MQFCSAQQHLPGAWALSLALQSVSSKLVLATPCVGRTYEFAYLAKSPCLRGDSLRGPNLTSMTSPCDNLESLVLPLGGLPLVCCCSLPQQPRLKNIAYNFGVI